MSDNAGGIPKAMAQTSQQVGTRLLDAVAGIVQDIEEDPVQKPVLMARATLQSRGWLSDAWSKVKSLASGGDD